MGYRFMNGKIKFQLEEVTWPEVMKRMECEDWGEVKSGK